MATDADKVVAIATKYLAQRALMYWHKTRSLYKDLKRQFAVEQPTLTQIYTYHKFLAKQAAKHNKRKLKRDDRTVGPPSWSSNHYQFMLLFAEATEVTAVLAAILNNLTFELPEGDERTVDALDPEQPWFVHVDKLYNEIAAKIDAASATLGTAAENKQSTEASTDAGVSGDSGGAAAEKTTQVPQPPAETQQCPQTS